MADARLSLTPELAPAMDGAAAVWLPLSALRPNPRNPRHHGAETLRLARTIVRTTWGAPIIAQASTHRIIGGHGRLVAAEKCGRAGYGTEISPKYVAVTLERLSSLGLRPRLV